MMINLSIAMQSVCLVLLRLRSLGQDPSTEINQVRRRAYGATYFNAHAEVQYPNDVSTGGSATLTTFYTDNPFAGGDEDPTGSNP